MTTLLILTIVLLLMVSAFFSACETAVTSASRAKLHQLAKDGDERANIIRKLQEKLSSVISVILTCNTMINTLSASIATKLIGDLIDDEGFGVLYASFIMGALILIYAEVMPKMVALHSPERFMLRASRFLNFIVNLFRPLNNVITSIARNTLSATGVKTSGQTSLYASLEELRGVIDMHQGPGQDVPQERAMLKSILDLGSVQVGEIMIHRKNVTMLNADNPTSVILDQILSCPFTRLPIYKGDPDNIVGLLKVRNELVALNRHSIEVFDNVGGELFPFQRIDGAVITKGAVGTHAKCLFAQTFAFVGGGRNEPISVYVGANGGAQKIATREIEILINRYSEDRLSGIVIESVEQDAHQNLYIHLPNETLVYDMAGSSAVGQPVWFVLKSGGDADQPYRAINFVYAYGKWIVGDKLQATLGYMTDATFAQYGQPTGWRFDTALIYNEGMGAIINSIELVGTVGRAATGLQPSVFCSYTKDGLTWSQERSRSAGLRGDYAHRMTWHRFGVRFGHWLGLRFRGVGMTTLAIPRLEIDVEPLNA